MTRIEPWASGDYEVCETLSNPEYKTNCLASFTPNNGLRLTAGAVDEDGQPYAACHQFASPEQAEALAAQLLRLAALSRRAGH